jgi:hypothetical protein
MKSWSESFKRRAGRRRAQKIVITFMGSPVDSLLLPAAPPRGPLPPWQLDLIERMIAERRRRR